MANTIEFIISAKNFAKKELENLRGSLGGLKKDLDNFGGASLGFGAAFAGLAGISGFALSAAADLEQLDVAFTTMLGSQEKAKVLTEELINFAKTTPFELQNLQQSTKQLLAYGFAQEEIIPNLEALGNISAGVGMDKLPNLILAFGQVKAATRLTGMELRQFTEAGVPLLGELSKQFGVTVGEVQDMVSAGEVGFPAVEKALKDLSGEGGRFEDLMTKQSKTFTGMMSNMWDSINIALGSIGKEFLELGKSILSGLVDSINFAIESFQKFDPETKKMIVGVIAVGLVFTGLATALGAVSLALPIITAGFAAMFSPIGLIIGVIALLAAAWATNFGGIRDLTSALWEGYLKPFFGWTVETIQGVIQSAITLFSSLWETHGQKIMTIVGLLGKAFTAVTNVISQAFSDMWGAAKIALEALGINWEMVWEGIKIVATLAWDFLSKAFGFFLDSIIAGLQFWKAVFTGDWGGAWQALKDGLAAWWDSIKLFLDAIWAGIKAIFDVGASIISGVWETLWGGISSATSDAVNGILEVVGGMVNWIGEKIGWVLDTIRGAKDVVGNYLSSIAERASGPYQVPGAQFAMGGIAVGGFKAFANGGIVSSPTLGLVGEGRYNEAVVPLPDGRRIPVEMRGGNQQPIINVNLENVNINNGDDANQFQRRVTNAVAEAIRQANNGIPTR